MVITFREQLQIDLATMMDLAVFGLTVNVDGVDMRCAESVDHGAPFPGGGRDGGGLLMDRRTLIFRATEMPVAPVVGQEIYLDGEPWFVADVARPLGHQIVEFSRAVT